MRRIAVRIDRLVLKGVQEQDRPRLLKALQQDLARCVAEGAARERTALSGKREHLRGGTVRIAPGTDPARVGSQVARRIAKAITS